MNNWQEMYYYRNTDGLYYVGRVARDGYITVTPYGFETKSTAINYIKGHGLKPTERKEGEPA